MLLKNPGAAVRKQISSPAGVVSCSQMRFHLHPWTGPCCSSALRHTAQLQAACLRSRRPRHRQLEADSFRPPIPCLRQRHPSPQCLRRCAAPSEPEAAPSKQPSRSGQARSSKEAAGSCTDARTRNSSIKAATRESAASGSGCQTRDAGGKSTGHDTRATIAFATPLAAAPPAAPPLDLAGLESRLRETKAIGVMTKLALKNQVDDLLDQFRSHYRGGRKTPLPELRAAYDRLLMKVLSLLQDGDPALAKKIVGSREAIWGILSDPKKFSDNNLMAGA